MMTTRASLVGLFLVLPTLAFAQRQEPRLEAGVFFTYILLEEIGSTDHSAGTSAVGLGGRIVWRPLSHLDIDGDLGLHPNAGVSGQRIQGFLGAKTGVRLGRTGLFAKVRPGFVYFSKDPFGVAAPDSTPFDTRWADSLEPALELGGVFEYLHIEGCDRPFRSRRHRRELRRARGRRLPQPAANSGGRVHHAQSAVECGRGEAILIAPEGRPARPAYNLGPEAGDMRSPRRLGAPPAVIVVVGIVLMCSSRAAAQTVPATACERLADAAASKHDDCRGPVRHHGLVHASRLDQRACPICRRSVALPASSRPRVNRRFSSRSGCRFRTGTASSRAWATVGGPVACPSARSQTSSGAAMRPPRPIPATRRRPGMNAAQIRVREAGTARRLRLSLPPRNHASGESAGAGVLRQGSRTLLLRRVLVGRIRRA